MSVARAITAHTPRRGQCLLSQPKMTTCVLHRFKYGLWPGMALSAVDTVLLRGKAPWTLRHRQAPWQAALGRCHMLFNVPRRLAGCSLALPPVTQYFQEACTWQGTRLADRGLHTYEKPDLKWRFCKPRKRDARRHADHEATAPAAGFAPRQYPPPDGTISFALNDSLYRRSA